MHGYATFDSCRALVLDRDRGCRYPGCPTTNGPVDVHHLTHWANGGLTDMDNLLSLCPHRQLGAATGS